MAIHREGVHHRSKSSYAYAYDEETVHVRLRTMRGDVAECTLLHGDKFDWPDSATRTRMERIGRDERFDYWQVSVRPPRRRLCYAFHLSDGDESLWVTEWGFESKPLSELPTAGERRPLHYFEYPFLHPTDVHDPPEWVSDAVFYQIFPERFANGDPERSPESVEEWGGEPTLDNFFGGDLQGIIDNLDYLEDLGVSALYLTPIFESRSNHKYNTTDYTSVDPHFGDEETLRQLTEQAHDRGIRVMLDAVFNHCGREFEPFQDVVENGRESEYADWFHVHEFPIEFEPRPNYDTFGFEAYMPKLNTENPEVKEYLLDVAAYWVDEIGIDGWRLDVADEVDHAFWRELREEVKAIDPDVYILGEIWHDSRAWLRGDQFDAVMNYPFSYAVIDFLIERDLDAGEFADKATRFLGRYPEQVNEVLFNLLGSHDTPRLLYRCDGDERLLRLAFLLLFTYRGTPCLYYGDEVGMTGGDDPDCRRPMVWDEAEQNTALREFVQRLIVLRDDHRPLRRGRIRFDRERTTSDLLVYRRADGDETVGIAINRGDDQAVVEPTDEQWETLLRTDADSGGVDAVDGRIVVPPRGGVVWR
ncbi:glycoside hydrolase family 13 protein [Halopiger xanaduensis]|uniref:Cyclomaltodextrinase n=1 Tax=Halopiger xanaduensis (strain DSM 18323 / JCM 14033 / SH-6) TaxID=797210 RepID=F8D4W8_HALXS|nr:glycoside hydrolase family 13 protein [Halopiger xanaduensis]AEH38729.1 Cyclomaltodextrinase [Halopiger xanaduensis SH-6]